MSNKPLPDSLPHKGGQYVREKGRVIPAHQAAPATAEKAAAPAGKKTSKKE